MSGPAPYPSAPAPRIQVPEPSAEYHVRRSTGHLFVRDRRTQTWYLRDAVLLQPCDPPDDLEPMPLGDFHRIFQAAPCASSPPPSATPPSDPPDTEALDVKPHLYDPLLGFDDCQSCGGRLPADMAAADDPEDEADTDECVESDAPKVDAIIAEIEAFITRESRKPRPRDPNPRSLLTLYTQLLPVLRDNANGRWKRLYSLTTLQHQNKEALNQRRLRVLKTTNQELHDLKKSGGTLPDNAGLILIRDDLPMPDVESQTFEDKIVNAFNDDTFESQNYDHTGPSNYKVSVKEHMERHRLRQETHKSLEIDSRIRNILTLCGSLGTHVSLPLSVKVLGYTLLDILTECIQKKYRDRYNSHGSGTAKPESVPNWLIDVIACLRFVLFADRGAASLNHMDILNGTWVTCLSGCKLWFVYDGPWNNAVRNQFALHGATWVPQGQMKLIVLKPGDTLIMRPGYPIVHSVLTLEDSIMVGGMMWSGDSIINTMENLKYIMHTDRTIITNEQIPRQFPEYLDELIAIGTTKLANEKVLDKAAIELKEEDVEAVQSLKDQLYQILSCADTCPGGVCASLCPCKRDTDARRGGCTIWCHDSPSDFRDPALRCRNPGVPVAMRVSCTCQRGCVKGRCSCVKEGLPCTEDCHPSVKKKKNGLRCTNTVDLVHPSEDGLDTAHRSDEINQGELSSKGAPDRGFPTPVPDFAN